MYILVYNTFYKGVLHMKQFYTQDIPVSGRIALLKENLFKNILKQKEGTPVMENIKEMIEKKLQEEIEAAITIHEEIKQK